MPELPEVEILVRYLRPLLVGRRIRSVVVLRAKAVRPSTAGEFADAVRGAEIRAVERRAKYLRFELAAVGGAGVRVLLGHLGMTGRMYLQAQDHPRARHVSVVFGLGEDDWVYEDPRQFGGMRLGEDRLQDLGLEPLEESTTEAEWAARLAGSRQPIKVRLMDQSVIAGLGNIYASEALHEAGIAPHREARSLKGEEVRRLRRAIREVLEAAIRTGSSAGLDFAGRGMGDGLFYFGRSPGALDPVEERFRVYDREGQACRRCSGRIVRSVLGGRSTYSCQGCQR